MRRALAATLLALNGCDDGTSGDRLPLPPPPARSDAGPAAPDVGPGPGDAAPPPDAAPVEPPDRLLVATYNVENLFDLVDEPRNDEGEFTPAPGRWDAARLTVRLQRLSQVFRVLDADVVSVNEVENEEILVQLRDAIAGNGGPRYGYVAVANSRDPRGIDVALLSKYPIVLEQGHPINVRHECQGRDGPVVLDGSWPEARPILQVDLNLEGDAAPELTLLANHWKAKGRDSFPCTDEEHRRRSARQVVDIVGRLAAANPERGIVVLGDFNTWEFEAPLADVMDARLERAGVTAADALYNAWGEAPGVEPGRENSNVWNTVANSSYNFDGDWTRLDHIVVNGALLGEAPAGWRLVEGSTTSIHPDFALDGRGEPHGYDARSGEGYSDHLPVRVELQRVP
jgi:predicted extracellular nuclease